MSTDFNYGNSTIITTGPVKPKDRNVPMNARYRVETYADISSIPVPAVGELIFVLSDENNDNQQNIYVIKSLKASNLGVADSLVDDVVPLKTFLGTDDINLSDYITEDELNNRGYATTAEVDQKIAGIADLSQYQKITDNTLTTDHKKIPEAINEVNAAVKSISVPTKISQLHNDSEFVTETGVGTAISSYVEVHKEELKGDKGDTPENPNFTIGTVTKLEAGVNPTVTISGSYPNFVLNFGIPVGSGSATEECIYWGRLSLTEVGGTIIGYDQITADKILSGTNINRINPTTKGKTSFGLASTTTKYDYLIVAVPASKNYTVTKDNGFGSKVPFTTNGVMGDDIATGANGDITLNISGVNYKLYGEVLIAQGEISFYIDEQKQI